MKRQWIKIEDINPWDISHQPDGDWFKIVVPDPKDQKQHEDEIEYVKKKILDGVKIMPILVQEVRDGFKKLDGFKRYMARKTLGFKTIEAFVCEPKDEGREFNYDGKKLVCQIGGQSYARFPLVEYDEAIKQDNGSPGEVNILYNGVSLRVEIREAVHLHWGPKGRYRMIMGKKDFETFANAIINTDG